MVVPIIAGVGAAIGPTLLILLAVALIIHLLSKEELSLGIIAVVVMAYLYFTSR